jgi:hypothetical protein
VIEFYIVHSSTASSDGPTLTLLEEQNISSSYYHELLSNGLKPF